MKIAIVGNSHLAAFKMGWELIKQEFSEYDLRFFGSPATSMRALKVEDGVLKPTSDLVTDNFKWTSNGFDYISGSMDIYVCVGMGFSLVHLMTLLKSHRLYLDFNPNDSGLQLISDDFLTEAMDAVVGNSVALGLLDKLRKLTSAKIYFAPNPFASVKILDDTRYDYYQLESTRRRIYRFYETAFHTKFSPLNVVAFAQPSETVIDTMFTKEKYSRNAIKLKRGLSSMHNDDDRFHMNAEFGAVSLREILTDISRCD